MNTKSVRDIKGQRKTLRAYERYQARVGRKPAEGWFALLTIMLVLLGGTAGYSIIEEWNVFDSLYMTVITLATVGYGEVHPLSTAGRQFTIVLILAGVGVATVVLSTLAKEVFERQFHKIFEGAKMKEIIKSLHGHIIVCGYGKLSRIACNALRDAKRPLVIIERDKARGMEAESAGFLVVSGDATQDEALLEAGVQRARQLVSLISKDSENLYVVLSSRELNPSLFIVSRSEDESGEKRLIKGGANRIISPYRVGGQKIADAVVRPYVTDFLDVAASSKRGDLQIEEIEVPVGSPLAGKTLRESDMKGKTNISILAVISQKGEMVANPTGNTVIEAGTTLIGIGCKPDFPALQALIVGK